MLYKFIKLDVVYLFVVLFLGFFIFFGKHFMDLIYLLLISIYYFRLKIHSRNI